MESVKGTDSDSSAASSSKGGLFLVAVVLLACFGAGEALFGDDEPKPATATAALVPTQSPSPSPPASVVVPNVVGLDLPAAGQALYGADLRSEPADLSPRGRSVILASNWTVVATNPSAGTSLPPRGRVSLLVLKKSEAAWFTANPVMPKLPKGTPVHELTDKGGPLFGMSELVLVRYAKGAAAASATDPVETDLDGSEPAEEAAARAGLKDAHTYGTLVVGSIPGAGQPVRPGRLIVVTAKDAPRTDPSTGSGGRVRLPSIPDDDDDDDFNVPGWLCPTWFC